MTTRLKISLILLMTVALTFGYLNLFIESGMRMNFERLHIFLFNLCAGGTILVYFSEGKENLSFRGQLFLLLSISYALLAFFQLYQPAIVIGFILSLLIETVRVARFSWVPIDFFSAKTKVSEKFHHAALLCLSIGLALSSLVILNNEFVHVVTMKKLQLDTFFLGFSFPLSLISMSVIFSLMSRELDHETMPEKISALIAVLKNAAFWIINLGVILFFVLIIFEKPIYQVIVTSILFCGVMLVYVLVKYLGEFLQQKTFLTSGIFFLLGTAITGILYIILAFSPDYNPENYRPLLRIHAFLSLYGWNLSGLAVIVRYRDFPIRLHSQRLVLLHWIIVLIACPLGAYSRFFAVIAILGYAVILTLLMFTQGKSQKILQ